MDERYREELQLELSLRVPRFQKTYDEDVAHFLYSKGYGYHDVAMALIALQRKTNEQDPQYGRWVEGGCGDELFVETDTECLDSREILD